VRQPVIGKLYGILSQAVAVLGPLGSILVFVAITVVGLVGAAAAIVLLPKDHFRLDQPVRHRHPSIGIPLKILKNLLGWVLIPLGVFMSLPLVPGPGAVCILIGVSLVDFPGKRRWQRRILLLPSVRQHIDGLRVRFQRPPFDLE